MRSLNFSRNMSVLSFLLLIGLLGTVIIEPLYAQDDDLTKQAQNPVANLISVPFQNNTIFDVGPDGGVLNVLNIQPVVPFTMNENWNLITRTIFPIVRQPEFAEGLGSKSGLGDIVLTLFLSPAKPSKFIWGAGPVFQIPSASDERLGSEKWGIGPSFVGLYQEGPWLCGALFNQVWSFAGEENRGDVSQALIQPIVNYNTASGLYFVSAPIITANWEATDSDDKWTVPIGGGVGKLVRMGKLPVNLTAQVYYNAVKPDLMGDWSMRIQAQFLFPK